MTKILSNSSKILLRKLDRVEISDLVDAQDAEISRLKQALDESRDVIRKVLIDIGEGGRRGRAIDLLPNSTVDLMRKAIADLEREMGGGK